MQFEDASGVPYTDGNLYFYETGTTTPKNTYTSETLGTANANPVPLNAEGRPDVDIWGSGEFKLVVKDGAVTKGTYDPLLGFDLSGLPVYTNIAAMTALLKAALTTGDVIEIKGYSTVGDGGGGKWRWDSTSSATVNGGTIVASDEGGTGRWFRMYSGPLNVLWFGANTTPGTTNMSAAVQAAVTLGGDIVFPAETVLMNTGVVATLPYRVTMLEGGKIIPSLGLGGGKLFASETDDVVVEGLTIDATGQAFTPATGNTYIFFGGDGATKYYNHVYRNNKILTCSFSDGNTGATNLLVTHGIYVDNVNDVVIEDNIIDTISGACVFMRDVEHSYIAHNRFEANRWYTVNIVEGCKHWTVFDNDFLSTTSEGVYWGGAINTVSDQNLVKNSYGLIYKNRFSGAYSYGGVIRLQSSDYVEICFNELTGLTLGSAATGELTGIRTVTRGISASVKAEPCQYIDIHHNVLTGPSGTLTKQNAIYITNEWWAARNISYGYNIYKNKILSPDTSNYWEAGVVFGGGTGGFEEIRIEDNTIQTYAQTSPTVGGMIGFVGASVEGLCDKIYIGGNTIIDLGTPAASHQVGISLGAYTDNVINAKPNYIENLFYGVRTLTNSGPTLDRVDDQVYSGNTTDELFNVALSRYGRPLVATATYDPPNIVDGAQATTDITVTGATLGSTALPSFSLDLQGITVTAYVRVANSVRVVFQNETGGALDLASGTLKVTVLR
jgi:hypothetical protein